MYNVFTNNKLNASTLPLMSSLVNLSLFTELQSPIHFRSFSIKYVAEGCERYTVNGTRYNLSSGQYLLANQFSEGHVLIGSDTMVRGICIDVAPQIISEVVANHIRPDTVQHDLDLDTFFSSRDFLDNRFNSSRTLLGTALQEIDNQIKANVLQTRSFDNEFYYSLAECIVKDYLPVIIGLQNMRAVKSATRRELYRKISRGKEFIDAHLFGDQSVQDAARDCGLSEYHFFRVFRQAYGQSPRQYIISQRLIAAEHLMQVSLRNVSEIAEYVGYADIHAFGKAYRKHFGYSPKSGIRNLSKNFAVFDQSNSTFENHL